MGDLPTYVAWDDSLTQYDFGDGHPMRPVRLALTIRLARDLGVLSRSGVDMHSPRVADDDLLALVHDRNFIAAVKAADADPLAIDLDYGLGTDDNPSFTGMHAATARVVAGTAAGARAVWDGTAARAVNISGGLHHAMAGRASGFCIYNDVAVGIATLLDAGAERVAYVDTDVHHGDGVQEIFYDDPRVLTISLHEHPRTLFPGTGFPEEIGGRGAKGSAVNLALPPGTDDEGWLRAFHAVVPPLLRSWQPQVLVTQHGCDSHIEDPLAHLAMTIDGQRAAMLALRDLADEVCDGKWVATGGGGYAIVDVVPRAWTHLLAIAEGTPIDPVTPVPPGWLEYVIAAHGRQPPRRMSDGGSTRVREWENGYDPADRLDQAILATRSAAFPHHGLDPTPW